MYSDMATGKSGLKVSIIYDTMWHSTEKMSDAIMDETKCYDFGKEFAKKVREYHATFV